MQFKIIASKPRDNSSKYVVVETDARFHPFVSAVMDSRSERASEWYWGHYFATRADALAHFNAR